MSLNEVDSLKSKANESVAKFDEKIVEKYSALPKTSRKNKFNNYAYVVLIASFLISFISDGCVYSFGLLIHDMKQHYNTTQDKVNLVSSLNTGFIHLSGVLVSAFSNQFGCRVVVMIGAVFASLSYLACVFAGNIYVMMIAFGVFGGFAMGATYLPSIIIIAMYFNEKRGIATGISMAGSGVGAAVFAKFTDFLLQKFDWILTNIILSGIVMQCCILGALLRPIQVTKSLISNEKPVEMNKSIEKTVVLENKKKNVAVYCVFYVPFIYLPERARELHLTQGAILLSIIGFVNIPSRVLFGLVADRHFLPTLNLNNISLGFCMLANFLQVFLNNFYLQCFYSILFAIGIAGLNAITSLYLCELVGIENLSNAYGIVSIFRGVACLLGPFLVGLLTELRHVSTIAFIFTGSQFAISLVLSICATLIQFMKLRKNRIDVNQCTTL